MIEGIKNLLAKLIPKPINQFDDGTIAISSRMCKQILLGNGYSAGDRFEAIASDSSIQIYFGNPTGSGKTIKITRLEIITSGIFYLDLYTKNTLSTSGTAFPTFNLNLKSTNSPIAIVESGGTYTLGTLVHKELIPGGSGTFAVGGIIEAGGAMVLPEGTNIVLVLTNKSASSEDVSVRFLWHEG